MRISFLPSFLLGVIFQHIDTDSTKEEEPLISTWTISAPKYPNPTEKILHPRETATWVSPEPNPPSNQVFTIGQTVRLHWITDFDEYFVYLWQQDLDQQFATADEDPIYSKFSDDAETNGFNWIATTGDFFLSKSDVFFFSLGQNDSLTGVFTDHYFNLTDKSISTSISAGVAPSSSFAVLSPATSSSTVFTTTFATTTSKSSTSVQGIGVLTSTTATTVPASQESITTTSSSTSSATKLEVGLGLGLGIPIIALLAVLVFLKYRQVLKKHDKKENNALPQETKGMTQRTPSTQELPGGGMRDGQGELSPAGHGPILNADTTTSFYNKHWRRAELSEENRINELPANMVASELPS